MDWENWWQGRGHSTEKACLVTARGGGRTGTMWGVTAEHGTTQRGQQAVSRVGDWPTGKTKGHMWPATVGI